MEQSGYEVRIVNDEIGKGLFATKYYKEGDVIFEENPLVSCQFAWNQDYKYLVCDFCFKPLETAEENVRRLTNNKAFVLPYPECCETDKASITECEACGTKFCSSNCLNEALTKYHQSLCLQTKDINDFHPLVQLKETWKQMHYPPETATIMLITRMVAMINQATDKQAIISAFSQFCNKTVNEAQEITHNLLGDKFIGQIDVLRQMVCKAVDTHLVPEWFTEEGFRNLMALIGTNGQGIGSSPLSKWTKNFEALELPKNERKHIDEIIDKIYDDIDKVAGTFLNNEGSGLYSLQSCINHSCFPNAIVEFPHGNSRLAIKAIQDMHPGQEICISYLDECNTSRSRHSRQKILKSQYLFICQCDKCILEADDSDRTSIESESWSEFEDSFEY
ncbi:unnamed protein product [Trichogramma brassicae]|uniref:Protein-lysine N-trimethyltransferase SMYD5 n=1 Tax=Trichogramma brassicae TaxID=86971 RepID=A0A6H5IPK9_9HYME|nr:unnamed protein product [Trichogramma brassicae]